jgi:hypothetical protein
VLPQAVLRVHNGGAAGSAARTGRCVVTGIPGTGESMTVVSPERSPANDEKKLRWYANFQPGSFCLKCPVTIDRKVIFQLPYPIPLKGGNLCCPMSLPPRPQDVLSEQETCKRRLIHGRIKFSIPSVTDTKFFNTVSRATWPA